MSEPGSNLPRASNGDDTDPFEAPVLATLSYIEQHNLRSQARDCRATAYVLVALATGSTFFEKAEPATYFFGIVALIFWAIFRMTLKMIDNDERYLFTESHFLMSSKKRRQSHELSRLDKIAVTGPDTDDDNDYRILFDDGQEYSLSCDGQSKRFIQALSAATKVGITPYERSKKPTSRPPSKA